MRANCTATITREQGVRHTHQLGSAEFGGHRLAHAFAEGAERVGQLTDAVGQEFESGHGILAGLRAEVEGLQRGPHLGECLFLLALVLEGGEET